MLRNIFARLAQVQAGKLRFRFTDIYYVCSHALFYILLQTHYQVVDHKLIPTIEQNVQIGNPLLLL